jgi:hypothetical protein
MLSYQFCQPSTQRPYTQVTTLADKKFKAARSGAMYIEFADNPGQIKQLREAPDSVYLGE